MRRVTVKLPLDVPGPENIIARELRRGLVKLSDETGHVKIGAKGEVVYLSLAWRTHGHISTARQFTAYKRVWRQCLNANLLSYSAEPNPSSEMEPAKEHEAPSLVLSIAWRTV